MPKKRRVAVVVLVLLALLSPSIRFLHGRSNLDSSRLQPIDSERAFSDFVAWMNEPAREESRGVELARARRAAMMELIQTDPERAIAESLSFSEYESLSEKTREWVEAPFSMLADIETLISCGERGSETTYVTEHAETGRLETYVHGARLEMMSRNAAPVQGIRLGALAALRSEVFQPLEGPDIVAAIRMFPVQTPKMGDAMVAALAGGRIFYFKDRGALDEANQRMAEIDSMPGPDAGSAALFQHLGALMLDEGAIDFEALEKIARAESEAWTGTPRNMYVVMVDFPNLPGPPTDPAELEQTINTVVSQQIWEMSYEKTHIVGVVNPKTYRLPLNTNDYTSASLRDAALAALGADGINTSSYDTFCVAHKGPGTYGGLASVGGRNMWLKSFGSGVITHEFGHNYGALHASLWKTSGADPVDPAGEIDEYGDFTDIMGNGGVPDGHFNQWHKKRINWFDGNHWASATGSGTYRIYRSDHRETSGLLRALEIDKGGSGQYWVGYKQNYNSEYEHFKNGVHLAWKQEGHNRSILIDSTPQSAGGKQDSGLAMGRTFSDPVAGVHITPITKGGQTPDEWIDVVVNLGSFGGNRSPVATLTGPTNVNARSNVEFTVSATDPDGDALAYAWDVEDGYVKSNSVSLPIAQLIGGTVTVSCVVSDMKGGTTAVSQEVVFSDALANWTKRELGSTEALTDILVVGNEILVTGAQGGIYRSTNAVDWSQADLGSNRQIFGVIHDGAKYVGVGVDYDFDGPGWEAAVYTSDDGNAWVRRFDGGAWGLGKLHDIAQGNGVLVAVGKDGVILRSANGYDWNVMAPGTNSTLAAIAFGDGTFVAVGGEPVALTSPDGVTWTDQSSGLGLADWKGLDEVIYGRGRFLASGWYSGVLSSSDQGATFSSVKAGRDSIYGFADGRGVYFGVGVDRDDDPDSDINVISLDGERWNELITPPQDDRTAVAVYDDTFITVGKNGAIWQSDGVLTPDLGYAVWLLANEAALGAEHGPLDDADGDGHLNLVEYALGSGALDAARAPTSHAEIDTGYLTISVDRERRVSDVTYLVERVDELKFEEWNSDDTVVVSDSDTNLTVRSAIPASGQSKEFLRLKVELK